MHIKFYLQTSSVLGYIIQSVKMNSISLASSAEMVKLYRESRARSNPYGPY